MTSDKRIAYGAILLVILGAMRIYVSVRDNSVSNLDIFYRDDQDLSSAYTPKLQRKMDEIEALPELSFQVSKDLISEEGQDRNPFLFGLNQKKEEEAKARFESLAEQVEEVQETFVAPEPEIPVGPEFKGTILGILEDTATGVKRVSLSLDDEIFVLIQGETFKQDYRVASIGYTQIVLEKQGFDTPIEIDISPESPSYEDQE